MDPRKRASLRRRYRSSDLRGVVGASATAYGYTPTVWSTGSILAHAYGLPSPPEVFSFFGGAVLAFAAVGILAFGGVQARPGGAASRAALWGSFHFLSVGLAVGAAWLISAHAASFPGWPLGAFAATALYLAVVAAENAVADLKAESGE